MGYSKEEVAVPRVSVVIPTVNRKKWVTEALESVFSQTYPDYEIIVVDDGSSDGTSEELKLRYGDRIRLFRNGGSNPPTAKNIGASHARGEYLAFLDDDDLWYPTKLEKQVRLMDESGKEVGMVGAGCDYIDAEGEPYWKPSIPENQVSYEQCCIKVHMPGSGSNELIRRSVFQEVGGFDNSLPRGEDRDCWIRISRKYKVLMIPEVLCTIRIHKTERKGVNFKVIYSCRKEINRRIPERNLRRKADAWLYYYLFTLLWPSSKFKSILYAARSFLCHPASLGISANRVKGVISRIYAK